MEPWENGTNPYAQARAIAYAYGIGGATVPALAEAIEAAARAMGLEYVRKLQLVKGDVLTVKAETNSKTARAAMDIHGLLQQAGHEVVIIGLEQNTELSQLDPFEMEKHGWVRKIDREQTPQLVVDPFGWSP